jgi:mRNA interferase HigB
MHILPKSTIEEYIDKHADAKQPLLAWYEETEHADWSCLQDIKDRYSSADYVPKNKVVFNIKGNKYRLVVKIAFKSRTVYILKIGTHAEYDKWDIDTL